MASNINLDDFIDKLIDRAHYNVRKTPDGSHLSPEEVKKSFKEVIETIGKEKDALLEKTIENSNKLAGVIEKIGKAGGSDAWKHKQVGEYHLKQYKALKNAGLNNAEAQKIADKRSKLYEKKLDDQIKNTIEEFTKLNDSLDKGTDELSKKLNEAIKKLKNELTDDAWANVSGGRNNRINRKLDEISSFGEGLTFLADEKSSLGKFGKNLADASESAKNISGKFSILSLSLDGLTSVIEFMSQQLKLTAEQSNVDYTYLSKELEVSSQKAIAELQAESQKLQKRAEIDATYITSLANAEFARYNSALDTKLSSFSDITSSAYKALEAGISYKYSVAKAEKEKEFSEKDLDIQTKKIDVAFEETKKVLQSQEKIIKVEKERATEKITNERISSGIGTTTKILGGAIGGVAGAVSTGGVGAVGGAALGATIGDLAGNALSKATVGLYAGVQDFYYQQQLQNAQYIKQSKEIHQQYKNLGQEAITAIENTSIQAQKNIALRGIDSEEQREKQWANFTADLDKKWEIAQNSANEMGVAFGYVGSQLQNFEKGMFNAQLSVSKWGKKMEDIQKLQDSYSSETGRNIELTNRDLNSTFAMGTFWGDDLVSSLNSGMEIFNMSVSDSNEMFFEMHKNVLKMGLNGKKYAKDLLNNLKLAEKYNFKNGVKSLMEMSKWAQNMRFNINSLDGMIDKVQTGGLEGIIKQSAELQVLGGNFAMGSNPLAMAYESYMDPEAYAKRLNDMLAGQGIFNSKTGEVSFGIASQQMMRQYAESTGQDYKDVLNQARQQVKINKIHSSINPSSNFSNDEISMIANKAKFNSETKSWEINTGNKDEYGNDIIKDVNEITPEDLKLLINDSGKTLEETALESLSMQRKQLALQETMVNDQMNRYEVFMNEHYARMNNVWEEYKKNRTVYQEKVEKKLSEATTYQKDLLSKYEGLTSTDISNLYQMNAATSLSKIETNLNKLIEEIGIKNGIESEDLNKLGNDRLLYEVKKQMDFLGGFDKAKEQISNSKSSWYTDASVRATMDMLRANSLALNDVTDEKLKKQLAELIFRWDDDYTTTDLDYHNDADLSKIYYDAVGNEVFGNGGGGARDNLNRSKIHSNYTGLNGESYSATRNISNGIYHDGIINKNGTGNKINDGLVIQNGVPTRIDSNDQVLAAKEGGPLDRMLDMVKSVPMKYDSYVMEKPYTVGNNGNGKIELAPLQININGNIQLNSPNGSIDITEQIAKDPNFIRNITQMISMEVEKKIYGGRVTNPINRNLEYNM